MTDIAGLVERLEAATGRDRAIDGEIAIWEGWTFTKMKGDAQPYWRRPGRTEYWDRDTNGPPPYTNSIDAALSLVERKLPTDYHFFELSIGHKRAHCEIHDQRIYDPIGTADAPTAPLSILIALLKALEQKAAP